MTNKISLSDATGRQRFISRLFWFLVAVDGLLVLALGYMPSTGSDAAGNGMASGFAFFLQLVAFVLLALLCAIFAFVRAMAVRYVLIAMATAFCLTLLLLALFSMTS